MNIFLLALLMLIGGLVVCYLSPGAKNPTLVVIIWWLGIIVAICGALLLITPILIFVSTNLKQALGA